MTQIIIEAGPFTFEAKLETELAPETCKAFAKAMPYESQLVHVRWSGEGMWVPLGDRDFGVGYEDATSYPAPGQVLLYLGGKSETEILIAYGCVQFASKAGTLAGNHFATIISDLEKLREIGVSTLWEGKKSIMFTG